MIEFTNLFLYFVIYSFLGWVLETAFVSIKERKLINRGFLTACFCPIYGFAAILIIKFSSLITMNMKNYYLSTFVSILLSIILVSALEYLTGFVLELIFDCKWWDYSDNFANLHGYICLKYSLLWGLLGFILIQVIHPLILQEVINIPVQIKLYYSLILISYFIIDTIKSIIDALDLKKVIFNYSNFTINKYYQKILKYQRIFRAYPRLMILNAGIINRDIRSILNDRIDKIKMELKNRLQ